MDGMSSSEKPLYCHWDTHDHDVLFMNETELDQHLYSHFQQPITQDTLPDAPSTASEATYIEPKPPQNVECHWDACHEMFDIDEIMEHFRTSHQEESFYPHHGNCVSDLNTPPKDISEDNTKEQQPVQAYVRLNNHSTHSHDHNHSHSHSHSHTHGGINENHHNHNHTHTHAQHGANGEQQHFNCGHSHSHGIAPPPSMPHIASTTTPPDSMMEMDQKPKIDTANLPTLDTPESLPFELHRCMWCMSDGHICGEEFMTSSELNAHIVHNHVGTKATTCEWNGCERDRVPFCQRQKLVRHLQVHAKSLDHKCKTCNKAMGCEASLKEHERSHTNEKPYKCEKCGKCFKSRNSLNVHIRTHTGAKPLVCTFPGCGKRFSESSNLAKHRRIHLAPEFECPHCHRKFTRKDHLHRHMRTKNHFEPRPKEEVDESKPPSNKPARAPKPARGSAAAASAAKGPAAAPMTAVTASAAAANGGASSVASSVANGMANGVANGMTNGMTNGIATSATAAGMSSPADQNGNMVPMAHTPAAAAAAAAAAASANSDSHLMNTVGHSPLQHNLCMVPVPQSQPHPQNLMSPLTPVQSHGCAPLNSAAARVSGMCNMEQELAMGAAASGLDHFGRTHSQHPLRAAPSVIASPLTP